MQKRIFYLDFIRVLAILLVLMLHSFTPLITTVDFYGTRSWYLSVCINEVSRMGVPLFFMISGYLLLSNEKNENVLLFYKKRLPRILIPLIFWNAIYFFYYSVTNGSDLNIRELFLQFFNNGSAYHMWFVYTLFAIYLITPFLIKIVKSSDLKQLFILFLIVIFPGTLRPLWNTYSGFYVYLFSPLMESYLGYFLLGYILSKIRIDIKVKILSIVSMITGFVLGTLGNVFSSSYEQLSFPYNGGYSLNHYLLASGAFLLIKGCTEKLNIPESLSRTVSFFAEISFGVYWVHVIVLDYVVRDFSLSLTPILFYLVHFIAVTVISIIISSFLYFIKPLRKILM